MKRLFSILATAGLFVAGTNTVSAKGLLQQAAYFARCGSSSGKRIYSSCLRSQFITGGAGFMGIRSFMF